MNDRLIERIRALLALSASSNEHEAQAAATQASRLMMKHQISEAEVQNAGAPDEPIAFGDPLYTSGKRAVWKNSIGHALALAHGCRTVSWQVRSGHVELRILGRASDVSLVRYLFAWIVLTAERLAQAQHPPPRVTARKWRGDWLYGFSQGVARQLAAMRVAVRAEAPGAAIVLVDAREAAVAAKFDALSGVRSNINRARRVLTNAYESGLSHGKNMHLGRHLPGAGPRLLTG